MMTSVAVPEANLDFKRPKLITFFAWLSLIASVLSVLGGGLALYQMVAIPPSGVSEELYSAYFNGIIQMSAFRLVLGFVYAFQGIGMLKLKKWLPMLVYISFAIGMGALIYDNYVFIVYSFSAVAADVLLPLIIGGAATYYIYSKRNIFVN